MAHSRFGRGASSLFLLLASLFAGAAAQAQEGKVQGGDLMLADFEGGKAETVSGLAFIVIGDEQLGGLSGARLTVGHPGAKGTKSALRISFHMADGFQYPFSGVWALLGTEGMPADLTAYKGLRFYARSASEGGAFLAGVRQITAPPANYMAAFDVKPDWTLVELPFAKLQRVPPTGKASELDPEGIISIGFSPASRLRGQFDLEIDQLELYK